MHLNISFRVIGLIFSSTFIITKHRDEILRHVSVPIAVVSQALLACSLLETAATTDATW